jgi:cephalosporin hydroxylase
MIIIRRVNPATTAMSRVEANTSDASSGSGRPAPYLHDVGRTFTALVDGEPRELDIYSEEGFQILSNLWLRSGWQQKFSYELTWLGIPIIQLPEDVMLMHELLWKVRPDVVVECGVAHGGALMLYASVLELLGKGHVVGVDVEIRKYNRLAIESHALSHRITLIEGDSVAATTLQEVHSHIRPEDRVLVVLDSLHTREHVAAELEAYSPLVSPSSYLVVFDGVMSVVADAPNAGVDWETDNPLVAIDEFLTANDAFRGDPIYGRLGVTYCPAGFLLRREE